MKNETAAKAYEQRMTKVFEYINNHLFESLSVETLSQVAHFSKFHFHRQFSEYYGVAIHKYIQLIRLKQASYQLAFRKHWRIVDIALSSGFENAESFCRAFKKTFGQTPTQFRNRPQWQPWQAKYDFLNHERLYRMKTGKHNSQVNIVHVKATRLGVLEHRGAPESVGDSIRTFIQWRQENNLSPKVSETYNIVYDDPATTEPENYRLDIGATVCADVKENAYGVVTKVIPAGRCAVLRHIGANENIGASVRYLYAQWLPDSGEELRDFPCYFHRVTLFPDVPEHEMITDIYLPLK